MKAITESVVARAQGNYASTADIASDVKAKLGGGTIGVLIREEGAECEILFANDPRVILQHTQDVLCCDIHTRARTKRILREAGAPRVRTGRYSKRAGEWQRLQ